MVVFIDSTKVGTAMVGGIYQNTTFHTIAPLQPGKTDIGDVTIDPAMQTATASIDYNTLLADLGLSPSAADYLGSIDDLSLRYANPDIDGDGLIDVDQGDDHSFGIDFHLRWNLLNGPGGPQFTMADMTDKFFPTSGDNVPTPVLTLSSIYASYPLALDGTQYVQMATNGPGGTLINGASFACTQYDGSDCPPHAEFSGGSGPFGPNTWGVDFDQSDVGQQELPGSEGVPAQLAFTLGATNTTLTFPNVVTQTREQLNGDGTMAIFTKLNTVGGTIASVDYEWMKFVSGTWTPASAEEIALTIGSAGGFMSAHIVPNYNDEVEIALPAQPTGTVPWPRDGNTPDDICALAVSFDDKIGMRHFIGGASPNPGVTCPNF